jgi:hypothetical protein
MVLSMNVSLSHSKLLRRAERYKKEVLLQVLTSRHCARRAPYLSKAYRKGETDAWQRLRSANLTGVGFGLKETNGAFTGDVAVRVYVTRKLPTRRLLRQYRVPDSVNGIPTDVVPVGPLQLQSRPAPPGTSVSHVNGEAGSIGCILSKAQDSAWYLLSASHVLAPDGTATLGDQILEPAASNGGTLPIADLTDYEPLKSDDAPNLFDAGIARIIRKGDVMLKIPVIGSLEPNVMDPALFQSVRKYGAGTLHTLGVITDVAADAPFTLDGETYLFQNVIQITGVGFKFSDGGDSGALVVDAMSNRPVCLVIGGADVRTYASPMERILTRFGAQIAE